MCGGDDRAYGSLIEVTARDCHSSSGGGFESTAPGSWDNSREPLAFDPLYNRLGLIAIVVHNDSRFFAEYDTLSANVSDRPFDVKRETIAIYSVEVRPNSDYRATERLGLKPNISLSV